MSNTTNSRVNKYEAVEVRFDGFESLPARKGHDFVLSPEFTCFGHQWRLQLFPGGERRSLDGYAAVFLHYKSDGGNIKVHCTFDVKVSVNKIAAYAEMKESHFHPRISKIYGWANLFKPSIIIGALKEGSLVIEVQLRQTGPAVPSLPFVPENPICKIILKKFMDEKSADITFEVNSEEGRKSRNKSKRAKTSPTKFHAHRFILQDCAPTLAAFCGNSAVVTMTDVKPDIFRHLLYYVYGGKVDDEDLKANAKEIIDISDKCGVVNLKLEAEACYVKSTAISIDNMLSNLLYADAKNLALLKEAVMDFIVENGIEVAEKVSLKDVPGGLFADLLTAMNRGKKKDAGQGSGDQLLSTMRINDLRRKLDEKGLDVDGSREAMITTLKQNS